MIRNAEPFPWVPKGISDTQDSTTSFEGAMQALTNLIPDPTTAGLFQCRPAAAKTIDLTATGGGGPFSSGFSTGFQFGPISGVVGVITVFKIIGNFVYGLVTNTTTSKDVPFAFNLTTGLFMLVTGVTASNVPQAAPATGAWTPPTMDLIGSKLVVTHTGFSATSFFFGWFDISTPTAPVWNAGNLTGAIAFTVVPTFVAQFSGRAYFITNVVSQPAVVFSDVLNAINCTNATQVLTFGDTAPLTALGQLRFFNQSGGIIQGLIVFKDSQNTYQVTGDAALSNLAINAMNFATGTAAPNTVCSTPKGLAFVSPDGLRIIDFYANISDPVGLDGQGIVAPFIYSSVPSRMCAACSGNIIRVTTQNSLANGSPQQEYWYDLGRQIWTGPHTSAAGLIQPYAGSFLLTLVGVAGKIFKSDIQQSAASMFVENGLQMNWTYTQALLPNFNTMSNYQISQSLLDFQFDSSAPPITALAINQNNSVIDQVSLRAPGAGTFWGSFTWGQANWGSSGNALAPRQLDWHLPLVFAKMQMQVTGQAAAGVRIGAIRMRMKKLRYLQDITAAA